MSNFNEELSWSLQATNTSTAVSLLGAVWPDVSWVTSVSSSDYAGCDLFGKRRGLPNPLRIDAKFRRVTPWYNPQSLECVFDVDYTDSDGHTRPGPVLKYGASVTMPPPRRGGRHRTPQELDASAPPSDFLLFAWPQASPPTGLLVHAYSVHRWLATAWVGLETHTSATTRADGLSWTTRFVVADATTINAACPGAARLLTLTASGAVENVQAWPLKRDGSPWSRVEVWKSSGGVSYRALLGT